MPITRRQHKNFNFVKALKRYRQDLPETWKKILLYDQYNTDLEEVIDAQLADDHSQMSKKNTIIQQKAVTTVVAKIKKQPKIFWKIRLLRNRIKF